MFWFENGHALLNVADRFSFHSADGAIDYEYTVYDENKYLNVDRILRLPILEAKVVSKDRLNLIFENGDVLSVYDNPEFRSWWFLGGSYNLPEGGQAPYTFEIGDWEIEDLSVEEIQERLKK